MFDAIKNLFKGTQVTVGPSPKVLVPAVVLVIVGAVLLVLGLALGDPDLTTWGGALLVASGVVGGGGAVAAPGHVVDAARPGPRQRRI